MSKFDPVDQKLFSTRKKDKSGNNINFKFAMKLLTISHSHVKDTGQILRDDNFQNLHYRLEVENKFAFLGM